MTHDQSYGNTPPDQGTSGDVSTTGHSTHDTGHVSAVGDAGGDHAPTVGGHGAHGGTSGDVSDVSTLVPVSWRQLIFPALILILVAILVAGPIANAFAPKPSSSSGQQGGAGTEATATVLPTAQASATAPAATATTAMAPEAQPSATTAAVQAPPAAQPTETPAAVPASSLATRTAVALAGQDGVVTRAPVKLAISSANFVVQPGNDLLPDWKPAQDETTAIWIEGTYANHILYIPFSASNQLLFQSVKPGDTIKLTMDTGQVFDFTVTRSVRAANRPPTAEGEFTVTTAMAQDHAGVTLFLVGDPAPDRAVVQADFSGTISEAPGTTSQTP